MTNLLAVIALYVVSVFWDGYANSVLWNWFATPIGGHAITFAQAAGLTLLLSAFLGSRGIDDKPVDIAASLLKTIMLPAIALGLGWSVHWLTLHA